MMRKFTIILLLTAFVIGAGCSAPSNVTPPIEREAQVVESGCSPAAAFQYNTYYALEYPYPQFFVSLDLTLVELGATVDVALAVLETASLVNACIPVDVDLAKWDEWLRATMLDVDVPEWDEWLKDVDVPEWDEWLLDVDVPEWDEWLLRFDGMDKYRPTDWMEWAVYGPAPIVDVDVPEWDEWLLNLTLGDMAASYEAWWIEYDAAMRM
jgi:hypothetical protein